MLIVSINVVMLIKQIIIDFVLIKSEALSLQISLIPIIFTSFIVLIIGCKGMFKKVLCQIIT